MERLQSLKFLFVVTLCLCMPFLMGQNKGRGGTCGAVQGESETDTGDDAGGEGTTGTGGETYVRDLLNPPEGFSFVTEGGDAISSIDNDDTVYLQGDNGARLFSFTPQSDVDFSNVTARRTTTKGLVHFSSNSDKSGIVGTVVLHIPRLSGQNAVRICRFATTDEEVSEDCSSGVTLCVSTLSLAGYTLLNPSDTNEDFRVGVNIVNFNTGGVGTTVASGCGEVEGGGGEAVPSNTIRITVTDVPGGDPCRDGIYAAAFLGTGGFDQRDGEVQVQLVASGGDPNTFTGDLVVGEGVSAETVYIYCDDSQESYTATIGSGYDNNNSMFGASPSDHITPVAFTNQGQFNACGRSMDVMPRTVNIYTGPYSTFTSTRYSLIFANSPSTPLTTAAFDPPGVVRAASEINNATAGDRFASGIADSGEEVLFTFSGLEFLGGTPHGTDGGTLASWCQCILGQVMGYSYRPPSTMMGFMGRVGFTYPPTYPYRIGYFSDTARGSTDTSGSCILP